MDDLAPDTPMHRAVLRIEYDGTPYCGWVRQPDVRTVEGDLLAAFTALGCTNVELQCAGRTDAGVHAVAQVADAAYSGPIEPARLARALATHLPDELTVVAAADAPLGFDARFDATSRAYEYRLLTRPMSSPVRARTVVHHPRPLDRDLLDAMAAKVLGQHHFIAFTPNRSEHVYFDRTIVESRWIEVEDELRYQVRANAFLRRMVRMLVGTMLSVGRGELEFERFVELLEGARTRKEDIVTAPARGLTLVDVTWEPVSGLPLPPGWRRGRPGGTHPFSTAG
ncbi:MAG: tRNA pseudouridine synthase [Thermoleophilia bacterium]|nr:tRNA pseudouridine synthase [Thermoleophilia bacterium]